MNKPAVGFLSCLAGAAVVAAAGGGWYYVNHVARGENTEPEIETVSTIRIELRKYVDADVEGSKVDIPRVISYLGNPNDLYLVIKKYDGDPIKLKTHWDTPIGNGLRWSVDPPVMMNEISEIHIKDADTFSDDLVDRVIVDGRKQSGEYFDVIMLAEPLPGHGPAPATPEVAPVQDKVKPGNA